MAAFQGPFNRYDVPFSLRSERTRSRLSLLGGQSFTLKTWVKNDELFVAPNLVNGERPLLHYNGVPTGFILCGDGLNGVHYVREAGSGSCSFLSVIGEFRPHSPVPEQVGRASHMQAWERFILEPGADASPGGTVSGPRSASVRAVDELRAAGYTLMRHMLSPEEIAKLKRSIADEEGRRGASCESGETLPASASAPGTATGKTNKRLGNLPGIHPGGADLVALAADPLLHDVLHEYLGSGFRCATWSSNTLNPGNTATGPCGLGWHVDYPYHDITMGESTLSTAQPPLGVQVLWLLDDFGADNGGTMFLPDSALVDPDFPDGISFYGSSETPTAARLLTEPAGTVLIAHSAWWHRQTNNTTLQPRMALLGNYTPGWVVPKDNMERQWCDGHSALDPYLPSDWFRNTFKDLWLGTSRRGLYSHAADRGDD
jgi:Phytanoyl-CoA dioxygenase (PhyH)